MFSPFLNVFATPGVNQWKWKTGPHACWCANEPNKYYTHSLANFLQGKLDDILRILIRAKCQQRRSGRHIWSRRYYATWYHQRFRYRRIESESHILLARKNIPLVRVLIACIISKLVMWYRCCAHHFFYACDLLCFAAPAYMSFKHMKRRGNGKAKAVCTEK